MSPSEICIYGISLILLMFLGTIIGKKIQGVTHFAYPLDPVTVLLCAASSAAIMLDIMLGTALGAVAVLSILAGYLLGYFINGRQYFVHVTSIDVRSGIPCLRSSPWVIFQNEQGQLCRQDQTWSALWNQWRWKVYHPIMCGSTLEPNCTLDVKQYFYPSVEGRTIFVNEVIDTTISKEVYSSKKLIKRADGTYIPKRRIFKKQTITSIFIPYGQQVSVMQLIDDINIMNKANSIIEKLSKENYELKQAVGAQSLYAIGEFLREQSSYDPNALSLSTRGILKNAELTKHITEGAEEITS